MKNGQFPFGIFAIVNMLLTHTKRLKQEKDLGIACASDEFNYKDFSLAGFDYAPRFRCDPDRFRNWNQVRRSQTHLTMTLKDCPAKSYGSPSGFLPQ